jgi:hypothetical protein
MAASENVATSKKIRKTARQSQLQNLTHGVADPELPERRLKIGLKLAGTPDVENDGSRHERSAIATSPGLIHKHPILETALYP